MVTANPRIVGWALELAESLLGSLHPRWAHVQAVTRLAEVVAPAFDWDPDVLVSAAALHDIGYATELARTGFHPLDGARCLREQGHEELAVLVAHHSGARHEAALRGFREFDSEFPFRTGRSTAR
jgi:HD superfamily phosphodiesterase